MIEIKLTQGYIAFIDDCDAIQTQHRWQAHKDYRSNQVYAVRHAPKQRKLLMLHREIMQAPIGVEVDHIDLNGLNNLRSNLRLATRADNARNKKPQWDRRYKGAYWHKLKQCWIATIVVNNRAKHLGYFTNEIDAAKAYDKAALLYFGEFARLNFPLENAALPA